MRTISENHQLIQDLKWFSEYEIKCVLDDGTIELYKNLKTLSPESMFVYLDVMFQISCLKSLSILEG